MFSMSSMAAVLGALSKRGVEFVIIGSTCAELAMGKKKFEGDIDLFVSSPSPLAEEGFFRELAAEEGWEVGQTSIGTPKFVASVAGEEVEVELYENVMDFEVPEGMLAEAVQYSLNGLKVRALRPEHYFVLKARQGVDLDRLRAYAKSLRPSRKLIERSLGLFPEDEREIIASRLRDAGLMP